MSALDKLSEDEQRYIQLNGYVQKLKRANADLSEALEYQGQLEMPLSYEDTIWGVREHCNAVQSIVTAMQSEKKNVEARIKAQSPMDLTAQNERLKHFSQLCDCTEKLKRSDLYVRHLLDESEQSQRPEAIMSLGFQHRHHYEESRDVIKTLETSKVMLEERNMFIQQRTTQRTHSMQAARLHEDEIPY